MSYVCSACGQSATGSVCEHCNGSGRIRVRADVYQQLQQRFTLSEAARRDLEEVVEGLKSAMAADKAKLGRLAELITKSELAHGRCHPVEENACTACMAKRELVAWAKAHRPIVRAL